MSTSRISNNPGHDGLDSRSLSYADDVIPAVESVRTAREQAVLDGAPALSSGTCATLTMLARAIDAQAVVEIGTSTGASGLAFFAGMNEHGVLTSIDVQTQWQVEARRAFTAERIPTRRFRLIPGSPLDVLNNLRDGAYDIVFVNGDKLEYAEYLDQALRLLRPGGLVVLNEVLWQNKVADPSNDEDEALIIRETLAAAIENETLTSAMLPVGEGLFVGVKAR
ncbi:O-methyltransferase [Propionibacterium australiense]|uniref:SAM-dependent O-methyltransferase class I-type profile n=1 Tax=Propionibacterium australiense TaxID=119981 RepID=A0A383S822_9ACTN|nr:class I SAM-dependent methyltransferase [Propionibacterium australiense]SYZ33529.1 SAM-dependent O-methyltransferase class I-type profile [Propionibacterium australiense]VEH89636.1 Putative O-methyltransferase MSMEG_5073 [Propionibacterium australiense]